ncbi:MAG: single-stranded DNA-binding protein [Acidobacteria bacterium]|mgnify:CR=1 FL=1|nr:single-stranded DNA-binding protein [Acidobacteriota bacterium]
MSFNKITLVGHLGKDPELRYTPQGIAVCNFTMATNDKRRDQAGELQDVTMWFKVTLWRQQAENAAKYLAKGRQVYVEGRLRVDEWTDRDGNNRHTLEVQATDLQFLGGGGARNDEQGHDEGGTPEFAGPAGSSAASSGSGGSGFARPAAADDDIPF